MKKRIPKHSLQQAPDEMKKQTEQKQEEEKAAMLRGLLDGLKLQGRLLLLASAHKGVSLSSRDMACLGNYIAQQAFIIEQGFIIIDEPSR